MTGVYIVSDGSFEVVAVDDERGTGGNNVEFEGKTEIRIFGSPVVQRGGTLHLRFPKNYVEIIDKKIKEQKTLVTIGI